MSDAPCPFCGSTQNAGFASGCGYHWGCLVCGAKGAYGVSVYQARERWNRRVNDDLAEAEVARQAAQERDAREADNAYSFSPGRW